MYKFLVVLYSTLIISLSLFVEVEVPLTEGETIENVELAMRLLPTFLTSTCIVGIIAIINYILTDVVLLKIDKPATQYEVESADLLYSCIGKHIISLTAMNTLIYSICLVPPMTKYILYLLNTNLLLIVFFACYVICLLHNLCVTLSNAKTEKTLFASRILLSLAITTFIMLCQSSMLN